MGLVETRRDSGTYVAKHRPDAIVCSNDIAADTLLKTLKKLKVSVPKDVMVVGFDDGKLAAATTPLLTTIRPISRASTLRRRLSRRSSTVSKTRASRRARYFSMRRL